LLFGCRRPNRLHTTRRRPLYDRLWVMAECGVLGLRDQPQTEFSAEERGYTFEDMEDVQRITRDTGPLGTLPELNVGDW